MSTEWQRIEREASNKLHASEVKNLNSTIKRYQETVEELQGQLQVAIPLSKTPKQAAPSSGTKSNGWTPEEIAKLEAMRKANISIRSMAVRLGRARRTIKAQLKELNV